MIIYDNFCEDIFRDRVAVIWPWMIDSREELPFEKNPLSTAFVNPDTRFKHPYFAGFFYGGSSLEVIKLFQTIKVKFH